MFFTKIQGRFVQSSYLLQTNSNRLCFDFLRFQPLPFFGRGVQPYISPDHSLFFGYKFGVQTCDPFPSWQVLANFRWPSGLRKGTSEVLAHKTSHISLGQLISATLPRDPPSECLGLPRRNELKWTLEHVRVKTGPTVWLLWSSASGTCAKLQRLGGNRCGSPLCFSLFRSYSWVDATPWISIRWHVIQMDAWLAGWKLEYG